MSDFFDQVDTVSSEQFIGSLAAQQNCRAGLCLPANEVGCNRCGVGDRVIQVPRHFWQEAGNVRINYQLVPFRTESLCDKPGIGTIVAGLFHARMFLLKCNRVAAQRPTVDLRSTRHQRA